MNNKFTNVHFAFDFTEKQVYAMVEVNGEVMFYTESGLLQLLNNTLMDENNKIDNLEYVLKEGCCPVCQCKVSDYGGLITDEEM